MKVHTQGQLIAMKKRLLDKLINKELQRSQVAGLLSMHPNSVSRLKKDYLEYGEDILIPEPPGPKKGSLTHNRTPDWIEDIVVSLAKAHMDEGPIDIADRVYKGYGININQTTIWRILKRKRARYTTEYKRFKKDGPPKSYCLDTPGLELQMDACYPFGRSRKIASFDVIDDCSRWTYGRLYERENAENGIDFINYLIRVAPFKIQRIRVDNRYGKAFKKYCESIGIEVIVNDPYTPKQNGKVERFHKTLKREFFWKYCSFHDSIELMQYKYNFWQDYYNRERKHQGYGMNRMTPYQKITSTLFLSLTNINYPQNVTLTLQQYISGIFLKY
jgi:transposase InsO family protein